MFQTANRTLYNCNTARFDGSARALSEDELYKAAPSIFALAAHESRSARFAPIPTIEPLRALQREGFFPVAARQAKSRDEGRADFTKHLIRLRRLDDDTKHRVGDTVCEVILKNANDGTSAYDLLAGLFRISCLNSLVVQTGSIDTVKVRHTGDVLGKVIEGTYSVISEAQKALAAPDSWSALPMSRDARDAFAEAAHVLRFGDEEGNVATTVEPRQLLQVRRTADTRQDLWTTYNVVQENTIRGGVQGRPRVDENGRQRRVRPTRAIKGIDQDVKLNKALFILADRMSQLLAA